MKKPNAFLSGILVTALLAACLSGCGSGSREAVRTINGTNPLSSKNTIRTIRVATTFTGEDPYTNVWQEVLRDLA